MKTDLQSPQLHHDFIMSQNGFAFRSTSGEVFQLNATGRILVQWIQEGRDEAEMIQMLAHHFSVTPSRVRQDITAFWSSLRSLDLVENGVLEAVNQA